MQLQSEKTALESQLLSVQRRVQSQTRESVAAAAHAAAHSEQVQREAIMAAWAAVCRVVQTAMGRWTAVHASCLSTACHPTATTDTDATSAGTTEPATATVHGSRVDEDASGADGDRDHDGAAGSNTSPASTVATFTAQLEDMTSDVQEAVLGVVQAYMAGPSNHHGSDPSVLVAPSSVGIAQTPPRPRRSRGLPTTPGSLLSSAPTGVGGATPPRSAILGLSALPTAGSPASVGRSQSRASDWVVAMPDVHRATQPVRAEAAALVGALYRCVQGMVAGAADTVGALRAQLELSQSRVCMLEATTQQLRGRGEALTRAAEARAAELTAEVAAVRKQLESERMQRDDVLRVKAKAMKRRVRLCVCGRSSLCLRVSMWLYPWLLAV